MEKVLELVVFPLVCAALVAFYGSAFVKPKLFVYLLKPAIAAFALIAFLAMAFSIGALAGAQAVECDPESLTKFPRTSGAMKVSVYGIFLGLGCMGALILTYLCIFPANHLLNQHAQTPSDEG